MIIPLPPPDANAPATRGYQQEMLEESIRKNVIIAMDTGSGKTHIAVLRIKHEVEREPSKVAWFFAPTVALCAQQKAVIQTYLPVSVGLVSGALQPEQWKSAAVWEKVLQTHRVIVSTPQVFLDALRHAYIDLDKDISILVFDEAHHATGDHPYARIMLEFYHTIPEQPASNRIYGISQVFRPFVMGLTASPIYGGNVERAFYMLEKNLDCIIRSPRLNRTELESFVHRPVFQHVMYELWETPPFSTNLASISNIVQSLKVEEDPYVISLRQQLSSAPPHSSEYNRTDQKLSTTIRNKNTFTLKGLRDFERAAADILFDLGPWAADWFIWRVIEKAKDAANPYNNIMTTWKPTEKDYLLKILNSIILTPISYHPDDIMGESSHKVQQLITALLTEKCETEERGDVYSGLIFVQRRDSVLALAEVLNHHPFTRGQFRIGILLGTSDNAHRHSFLDITRKLAREGQEETVADFRSGELNLIIATAVAEEGLDIQACGSVIRWDLPPNMASWAQSRGRARRKRSTFTLMFARGSRSQQDLQKWEDLERKMVELYQDPMRDLAMENDIMNGMEEDEEDEVFEVKSTGARCNLHSAIAHLAHFCAIIPGTSHVDTRPIYDIDPAEMPIGWHESASSGGRPSPPPVYNGPWGSTVTLPRTLPRACREFTVPRIYPTKVSAHRHAAFRAYVGLYKAGLLNEHLLPLMSLMEPEKEGDLLEMLKDVDKRAGMANVDLQIDPWAPVGSDGSEPIKLWYTSRLCIGDLPPLVLLTRSETVELRAVDGLTLYQPGKGGPTQVTLTPVGSVSENADIVTRAKEYTRRVFWSLNWARMEWDNLDFAYLFYPETPASDSDIWVQRRAWLEELRKEEEVRNYQKEYAVNARTFGESFNYTWDPVLVLKDWGRAYRFVGWRTARLTEEEEEGLRKTRRRRSEDESPIEVKYPLLVVKPFHPRRNFLVPTQAHEVDYAFLLPSVLRSIGHALTMTSLRSELFSSAPSLRVIPLKLLANAMTASSAGERFNYQRLETLGDTVLKFLVVLQLLLEYPLWHEGYLTKKKDHTVSNVRLAKEDIKRRLFKWIVRDVMLGRKWKPKYVAKALLGPAEIADKPDVEPQPMALEESELEVALSEESSRNMESANFKKKKKAKKQDLSTKTLADVVESLIGAAYIHGGFALGYECAKLFNLGIRWLPPPQRIIHFLSSVEADVNIPPALCYVEQMLGYVFKRKILLLEALTHASYQQDARTVSYERMEFLGDSVLDMVVTDYLYHVPGKNYSPGHIHLRRSSIVNIHFLAFICLKTSVKFDATLPHVIEGIVKEEADSQEIFLWKCLLHSNTRVMDDQANTFSRFRKRKDEIEKSLQHDTMFPWAALTKLQAPKFFSDIIESVLGAVFLDSGGDIGLTRNVIATLGILPVLERIVNDNVDVWHPVSRISQWASKHAKTLEWKFEKEKGAVKCSVVVDGKVEASAVDEYRGALTQDEVKLIAAEEASRVLRLKTTHMNHEINGKGKGRSRGADKLASVPKDTVGTQVNGVFPTPTSG
ncbi:Dicer-like protein 2 [Leucoagaricus sp. SymC.cos]|nr:Dicer-like protein 2 [Leucoagaricus sp. SymC.cos]